MGDVVEALCLFDEPMLNSRYHGMLMRRARMGTADELAQLPDMVLESMRQAREAAAEWARKQTPMPTTDFYAWAESTILDSFLTLAESQLRIFAHIARSAPTAETRQAFDTMAADHREIARVLRKALKAQAHPARPLPPTRNVQEDDPDGDLRGQIEGAIRMAELRGSGVRGIVLSPAGLRHLRDQGCFRDGVPQLHGHSVAVDLGWDAPAFVIETYDRVALDEIPHA